MHKNLALELTIIFGHLSVHLDCRKVVQFAFTQLQFNQLIANI